MDYAVQEMKNIRRDYGKRHTKAIGLLPLELKLSTEAILSRFADKMATLYPELAVRRFRLRGGIMIANKPLAGKFMGYRRAKS
jgi:hypothetical protein